MMARLITSLRMALAAGLALLLLEAASWAVRDCSTSPDASDNCLWLAVQRRFGLPPSRLLRTGILEAVGLLILAGIFLIFRCLWPRDRVVASRTNIEAARTNT